MKEWAKWLYDSRRWQKTRAAYMTTVFGLCERCGQPGDILHHKVYLTPTNIHDPEIAMGWDNLELLCQTCHNREHFGESAATVEGVTFDGSGCLVLAPPSINGHINEM